LWAGHFVAPLVFEKLHLGGDGGGVVMMGVVEWW
jgi:hypothetical protein